MKLLKWSPMFDLSEESLLHPHLFLHRILFGLGSFFGRPFQTDNAMATGSRPLVDRILVELAWS
ncbi:hypothetical protein IEQ34_018556 [Dendrobium chrysotoxum]|uniref:Uncharacterized protein n=1 Tax=Dendrobium chrysotoxum TaxID=161865 RepID=A0AAV7G4X9_DENCH|nr:hypothetical protein IEQ34_018556 [Dendrobium chrysotoxum]